MSAGSDVGGAGAGRGETARDAVLRKVRAALGGDRAAPPAVTAAAPQGDAPAAAAAPPVAVPAAASTRERASLVGLLCERLEDYGAEVRRVPAAAIGAEVAAVCRTRSIRRLGIPPGLAAAWRPPGVEIVEDAGLSPHELDALEAVLTGCTAAIAATGTLLLTAGTADGRRALTLVPDVFVCVVAETQVVADLPAALAVAGPLVRDERRPLTFVSGPSATSDIELHRVEGVHGPRQLVVLVVQAGPGDDALRGSACLERV